MHIPLNRPYWGKREEQAVVRALRTTIGTGDGPYSGEVRQKLTKLLGCRFALPTTSCTHAMELALASLSARGRLAPGDEVIVPSFTMTSTANAVVLAGARPVFAEIDPVTYCIDPADIERALTKRTRGMMIVHYAGMPAPLDQILAIAKKYKLWVVEDAAHAIGATYQGQSLGTFGVAGAFSFHGTKNVSCGEGGALVTSDAKLAETAEIYRANGTNRQAFLAGLVAKYHWIERGSSYFLCDILASILSSQLDQIKTIIAKRQQIASLYTKAFKPFAQTIQLPVVPAGTFPNWHIYAIKFKTAGQRQKFVKKMGEKEIEAATHYVPLHSSPMGQSLGGSRRKLAVTEEVAQTLVRLPIYPSLTDHQLNYLTTTAQKVLEKL